MNLRTLAKTVSFLFGLCLTVVAAAWIYTASSGAVKFGLTLSYVAVGGLLMAAAPFLVFPFSRRLAKAMLALFALALALSMLWLAFQPDMPASHPAIIQVAAIALVVLLLARIGLALRRKSSAAGT